jgi:hypothetical protein
MKAVRFTARSVPFVFALTTITAYGLLLPLTGFYWDDWPFAWIAHFLGPSAFVPAFQGFRPFLGPIFFLTTSLVPASPVLWQALALLIRFVAALAVWFTLKQVWPHGRRLTLAAALLFLIFPGYSQHWVAFTHINQEWISLIAYVLSLGLSIRAIRLPGTSLAAVPAALLLQCVGLWPTEYFFGLELIRLLFFWAVLSESTDGLGLRLRSTVKASWPYLFLWLINAAWLAYYYRSGAYISYDLSATATAPGLSAFILVFGDAIWKTGFYVWLQALPLAAGSPTAPTSVATIAMIFLAFALLSIYLLRLDVSSASAPRGLGGGEAPHDAGAGSAQSRSARLAVLAGVVGILVGRVPSYAAGLPLTLQSSFDRLTISMMLGACLFVAGVLELLVKSLPTRTYALAALVALGIGQQFFNANIFRRDWQRQQEIYWQLAWRIPSLKTDTAILTQQLPLDYETDLAMTAAINWMYAPDPKPPHLPFAVLYTEKRLGGEALPGLRSGLPIRLPFRNMVFSGNTSQVIVVYVPSSGCLRVFDPAYDDAQTYSRFPEALTAAIPLSDPSRILVETPPRDLPVPPFSREPAPSWCYFYERAELSRQARNWGNIVALRSQAAEEGHEAEDPFEWLPFIEAEARAGDVSWAIQTTRAALNEEPRLERGLCALWRRVELTNIGGSRNPGADMFAEMRCKE